MNVVLGSEWKVEIDDVSNVVEVDATGNTRLTIQFLALFRMLNESCKMHCYDIFLQNSTFLEENRKYAKSVFIF